MVPQLEVTDSFCEFQRQHPTFPGLSNQDLEGTF